MRPRGAAGGARAWLELVRAPNLLTAAADPLAGALAAATVAPAAGAQAATLSLASVTLYAGGVALNDVADAATDARERPGRPIPSGRVSRRAAAALALFLLASGTGIAATVALRSAAVALALVLAVVAYDLGAKSTPAGPLVMGTCRALSFALGLSPALGAGAERFLGGALLLGAYVAAITLLARDEVTGNSARRAHLALFALGLPLVALAAGALPPRAPIVTLALLVLLGAGVVRYFAPLLRDAGSTATLRAVGGGILLIPVVDGVYLASRAGAAGGALLVAGLALPAFLLRRLAAPT